MTLDEFITKKNLLCLMLCIGCIQIAGYFIAGSMARIDGIMAVPQPDTLLYCQSARRIVEGHPFSMFPGTAMSTGNTTILYPFVLSIPYALGATGDTLLTAGFFLNALFYLIFLFGWGLAIWSLITKPVPRLVAALLIALSNQSAYCACAQSDTGMWMAASGLLVAGLASGNAWLYGPLLILGPWIRPEGMVCVIALVVLVLLSFILNRTWKFSIPGISIRRDGLIALAGFASVGGVFLLNYLIAGASGFSSVSEKGYFRMLPCFLAVQSTVSDLIRMAKELLLGIPQKVPRDFYMLPVLSAAFLWIGVFYHDWKRADTGRFSVWLLACIGGLLTVAMSGWQGTNSDRYLAWLLPTVFLFMAEGVDVVMEHLPTRGGRLLPVWLLVGASTCLAITQMFTFHGTSLATDSSRIFAAEAQEKLPPNASIGCWGNCGLAYVLGGHRFVQLPGIYSPEMKGLEDAIKVAILKNEPNTRFDCWLVDSPNSQNPFGPGTEGLYGNELVAGLDGNCVKTAVWAELDASLYHAAPTGLTLKAQIDIGYQKAEQAVNYKTYDRFPCYRTTAFIVGGPLAGHDRIIDTGRIILGWDGMTVPLATNHDAVVVMRTTAEVETLRMAGQSSGLAKFSFANPFRMNIRVNGQEAGTVNCSYATNGFSDVTFKIPGAAITTSPARVEFYGDHLTCGYWFYQ